MSVLVVAQSSSEIPEGLMNNPVYSDRVLGCDVLICACGFVLPVCESHVVWSLILLLALALNVLMLLLISLFCNGVVTCDRR